MSPWPLMGGVFAGALAVFLAHALGYAHDRAVARRLRARHRAPRAKMRHRTPMTGLRGLIFGCWHRLEWPPTRCDLPRWHGGQHHAVFGGFTIRWPKFVPGEVPVWLR